MNDEITIGQVAGFLKVGLPTLMEQYYPREVLRPSHPMIFGEERRDFDKVIATIRKNINSGAFIIRSMCDALARPVSSGKKWSEPASDLERAISERTVIR